MLSKPVFLSLLSFFHLLLLFFHHAVFQHLLLFLLLLLKDFLHSKNTFLGRQRLGLCLLWLCSLFRFVLSFVHFYGQTWRRSQGSVLVLIFTNIQRR